MLTGGAPFALFVFLAIPGSAAVVGAWVIWRCHRDAERMRAGLPSIVRDRL